LTANVPVNNRPPPVLTNVLEERRRELDRAQEEASLAAAQVGGGRRARARGALTSFDRPRVTRVGAVGGFTVLDALGPCLRGARARVQVGLVGSTPNRCKRLSTCTEPVPRRPQQARARPPPPRHRPPQVKASDARCAELAHELAVTREELARASAVAARVAASEAKAGIKVEGTVPAEQHGEPSGRLVPAAPGLGPLPNSPCHLQTSQAYSNR
jgi:hypothetical protein